MAEFIDPPRENQHTVPQAYLRGFANAQQLLWRHDLHDGRVQQLPVKRAAAIEDFYTLRHKDGGYTDGWEHTIFPAVENRGPRVFAKLEDGQGLSEEERQVAAVWMAVQILRTQQTRRIAEDFMREKIRAARTRPGAPPIDDATIERFVAANAHIAGNLHITGLASVFPPISNEIHSRGWTIVRFSERSL